MVIGNDPFTENDNLTGPLELSGPGDALSSGLPELQIGGNAPAAPLENLIQKQRNPIFGFLDALGAGLRAQGKGNRGVRSNDIQAFLQRKAATRKNRQTSIFRQKQLKLQEQRINQIQINADKNFGFKDREELARNFILAKDNPEEAKRFLKEKFKRREISKEALETRLKGIDDRTENSIAQDIAIIAMANGETEEKTAQDVKDLGPRALREKARLAQTFSFQKELIGLKRKADIQKEIVKGTIKQRIATETRTRKGEAAALAVKAEGGNVAAQRVARAQSIAGVPAQEILKTGEKSLARIEGEAFAKKSGTDRAEAFGKLLDSTGPRDPKRARIINTMRKEFSKESGEFISVRNSYQRVLASVEDPSPAGDLALIFNFMKMLDPGSTVREGEFANAENSAGVAQRIRGQYNKIIGEGRLSATQRADFTDRAERLFIGITKNQSALIKTFRGIARRNNLPAKDIVREDLTEFKELTNAGNSKTIFTKQAAIARKEFPPENDSDVFIGMTNGSPTYRNPVTGQKYFRTRN